jgi:hypothetical protein
MQDSRTMNVDLCPKENTEMDFYMVFLTYPSFVAVAPSPTHTWNHSRLLVVVTKTIVQAQPKGQHPVLGRFKRYPFVITG